MYLNTSLSVVDWRSVLNCNPNWFPSLLSPPLSHLLPRWLEPQQMRWIRSKCVDRCAKHGRFATENEWLVFLPSELGTWGHPHGAGATLLREFKAHSPQGVISHLLYCFAFHVGCRRYKWVKIRKVLSPCLCFAPDIRKCPLIQLCLYWEDGQRTILCSYCPYHVLPSTPSCAFIITTSLAHPS